MADEWIKLCLADELNLEKTLFTGQAFTWLKHGEEYVNVYLDSVVVLKELNDQVMFKVVHNDETDIKLLGQNMLAFLRDYFELDTNMQKLHDQWTSDKNFIKKSPQFIGNRILKQPPIETIFAFICSQNNNIKRITSLVNKLKEHYGVKYSYGDMDIFSFPNIENLLHKSIHH